MMRIQAVLMIVFKNATGTSSAFNVFCSSPQKQSNRSQLHQDQWSLIILDAGAPQNERQKAINEEGDFRAGYV